jgi:hypothetical protein
MALPGPTESCPECRRRDSELADSRRSVSQLRATIERLERQLDVARGQQLELSRREVRLRELTLEEERRRTQLVWDESSSGAAFRGWCAQLGELDRYCYDRARTWVQAWVTSSVERVTQVPTLDAVRGVDAPRLGLRRSRLTRTDRRRLDEAVADYNERLQRSLGPHRVELSRTQPGERVSDDLELYLRVLIAWTPDAVGSRLHEWRALAHEGAARQVRATDLPQLHYPRVTPRSTDFPARVLDWYDGVRTGAVSS